MVAGRKPKPPALKILEGNPGKRAINRAAPTPRKDLRAKAPVWLEPEAKREWRRVAPELERLGLLSGLDQQALAQYCQAYARWRTAEEVLSMEGLTYEYTNKAGAVNILPRPEVGISVSAQKAMRAICAEFGMTPSSRGRMTMPDRGGDDELDGFLTVGESRRSSG